MKFSRLNQFAGALKFGRPYIGRIILISFLNIVTVITDLGFIYLLKLLIDAVFAPHDLALMKLLALSALGIMIFRSLLGYANGYLSVYIDTRMENDLRNTLYAKIHQLSLDFHAENSTGSLFALIFHHAQTMLQVVTSVSGTMIRELIRIPAMTVFLFHLHTGLAFATLLVFPPTLIGIRVFRRMIMRTTRNIHETLSKLYTTTEQTLSHMEIVKTFAKESEEIRQFENLNNELLSCTVQAYKANGLSGPVFQLLKMLCIAFLVFIGTREVAQGKFSIGELAIFLASAYYLYGGLSSLGSWYLSLVSGLESADRVLAVLNLKPSFISAGKNPGHCTFDREIAMSGVCFRYSSGKKDVLKGTDLVIKKGETVAIAGPSGSGKSTLVRLVLRLYEPTEGSVTIDGQDISLLDLKSLKSLFGVAPQDSGIFQDTVLKAIAYGRTSASLAEIHEAARLSGAHDFIAHLPQGYDTLIGERGIRLSGGEKQRISLARALLRNPEILVLDEALSSVDAPTEKAILKRILSQNPAQTKIFISHRLTSVTHADRILAIDNGVIAEQGSHSELMAVQSLYREWFLSGTRVLE